MLSTTVYAQSQTTTWSFEDQVLGDWVPHADLVFDNSTTGNVSDAQATDSTYSALIKAGDDARVGALRNDVFGVFGINTLRAKVFIPASDTAGIHTLQLFLLHGDSWDFTGTDYNTKTLAGDAWHNLELIVPEGVGASKRFGVQFIGDTTDTASLYIDLISVDKYLPPVVEVDPKQTAGSYTIKFDARSLASGVYLYRIQAGAYIDIKRMTLIK